MLPLDKQAAIERIIGVRTYYRIVYTASDQKGRVDWVRDIPAESAMQALQQAMWQLDIDHKDDHGAYTFDRMERIVRKADPAEGHPV